MPSPELFAETRLLCLCAGTKSPEAAVATDGELLNQPMDWEFFEELALRHNLLPLIFHRLKALEAGIDRDILPPEVRIEWQIVFDSNAGRCLQLIDELQTLMTLLEEQEISAVCYKGPVVSQFLYGNPLMRRAGDLDIWVPRSQLMAAEKLLEERGYRQIFHSDSEENEYAHRWIHDTAPDDDAGADTQYRGLFEVELHWHVLPPVHAWPFDLAGVWSRLQPCSIGTHQFQLPGDEDLMLVLCWHAYKHHWQHAEWVCGVAHLAQRFDESQWNRLLQRVRQTGSLRVVSLGLILAQRWFEASIPPRWQRILDSDRSLRLLARNIDSRLFPESVPFTSVTPRDAAWFNLRSRERLRDKALFAARTVRHRRKIQRRDIADNAK